METHTDMAVKSNNKTIWGHTRPDKAIRGQIRPYKANTAIQYHNVQQKITLSSHCNLDLILTDSSYLFKITCPKHQENIIQCVPTNISCSHEQFLFTGTFFELDSTLRKRRTTTKKLLLGPLSVARSQKLVIRGPGVFIQTMKIWIRTNDIQCEGLTEFWRGWDLTFIFSRVGFTN